MLSFLTNDAGLEILGLAYAAIMTIVNLVVLAGLIFQTYKHKIPRRFIFKAAGLMLINVPVLILYCWIGINLMNTVRITFINSTGTEIRDVKIEGCEEK